MPDIITLSSPLSCDSGPLLSLWTVSEPVGPGQTNAEEDVALVQALLRLTFRHPEHGDSASGLPAPSVSGKFDIATAYWILHAQLELRQTDMGRSVNGLVEPWTAITDQDRAPFIEVLNLSAASSHRRAYEALGGPG